MKRLFLIILSVVASLSLFSQTEEELRDWLVKGLDAYEQENHQESIRFLEAFKEGYGKLHGREDEVYGVVLQKLGHSYTFVGDFKAFVMFSQAVQIYKSLYGEKHPEYIGLIQDLSGDVNRWKDISISLSSQGNYTMALELDMKIVELCKSTFGENHYDYAMAIHNLASTYSDCGDNAKAIELERRALEIRKLIYGENHTQYAVSLKQLSRYYYYLGDYAQALEIGTRALEIFKSGQDQNQLYYASTLGDLATYYSYLGNYPRAVELGTQALTIYQSWQGDDHPNYASSLSSLASFFYHIGDYSKAIDLGTRSVNIYKSASNEYRRHYATSLSFLANTYARIKAYPLAIDMGTQAMEIYRVLKGEKSLDYATSLCNLSCYYSDSGDYSKAVEMGSKAMTITKAVVGPHHPDYAQNLSNLASSLFYLGDYKNALQCLGEDVAILQGNILMQFAGLTSSQRTMFWKKNSYLFTDVYPSFIYQSRVKTAPDLYDKSALFAKGLLLATEMEMKRLIQESGDVEALRMFEDIQVNRKRLQLLFQTPISERTINTDSLADVVDQQEQSLVRRSASYGDFSRKLRTTWLEVQQALHQDEIAIEFLSFRIYGSDSTMVAALTLRKDDKEPKFTPLFEERQLCQLSDVVYYYCPELTALVWQPLRQELKGIRRVYFSPSGVLHNMGIEYAPGMEEYEMHRLSSTREIVTTKMRNGDASMVASLYGGVDYDAIPNTPSQVVRADGSTAAGELSRDISVTLHRTFIDSLGIRGVASGFDFLPGTKKEVESIKRLLDKKHWYSTLHTGTDATETSMKQMSGNVPRILHVATHGFYYTENQTQSQDLLRLFEKQDTHNPIDHEDKALARSGLLFAGANLLQQQELTIDADDGFLTAQEISYLDLRGLDLVVLSACKTGNGDIKQGEGVFGLQRGFKKAGTQTIVMSLWEVADDATQILMSSFYDNLLQGQSRHQAFQRAQEHLRRAEDGKYNHPKYWAAFIMLD